MSGILARYLDLVERRELRPDTDQHQVAIRLQALQDALEKGGDRGFLAAVGVEAASLKEVIDGGAGDAEIARWVRAHAADGLDGRLVAYRERLLAPVAGELREYLDGGIAELQAATPGLDTSKVDNFTRLICLEEGHPCPGL